MKPSVDRSLDLCADAMRGEGLPDLAIRAFSLHLGRLATGETGLMRRGEIQPVTSLPDAAGFAGHEAKGRAALGRVAVVKLNGGLGTSMGLERAKSLLPVRGGLSFLDLIARQVLVLRAGSHCSVPVLFMNSFRTAADTAAALAPYPELTVPGLPPGFLQHKVPKVHEEGFGPARDAKRPDLGWCPPGHGDLYTALATTGCLGELLDRSIEYLFVSNADNLGAVLDPSILGFMVENRVDFLMEVADRTAADRKGGHLCRLMNGRLALRESAQCPPDEAGEFQDIGRYRYFNTNNLWVHLPTLADLMDETGGVLPLATIVNRKNLDPRDPASPPVIQLETAMGAAVSLFPAAAAIRVPRSRFSPVKTTNDLLAVRSDAFELTDDSRVRLLPSLAAPPTVDLDRRFFANIDDCDQRFPEGPPSLRNCTSFAVCGDVRFEGGVTADGDVRVVAENGTGLVQAGARLRGEVRLDRRGG